MAEVWKDIPGYEGKYQVSNLGRVKSLPRNGKHCKRTEPIMMYLSDCGAGYKGVTLYKDGKRKRILIHRTVSELFVENTDNKPEVNHINGIRTDNRYSNLEWVTSSENKRHSFDVLHRKTVDKEVVCIETGEIFGSITEAAQTKRICRSRISKCCSKEPHCKTAGGYHWRYKEA